MAPPPSTGMDKGEMKKLLMKSKKEPVNCAIGLGDDPSIGLLLLNRIKQPKAVEKDLVKQIPAAKNTRWGTALVDVEDNPKLVKISINKPISGMARKLVKTLKGTGFTKVEILLEDGSPVEAYAEEEEGQAEEEEAQQANAPEQTQGAVPPPPPPPPQEAPKPNVAELEAQLKALIPRVAQLDPADPRREDLAKRARQAGVYLKTNNLVYAAAEIESLRRALDAPVAPQLNAGGNADYGKSSKIWLATRKRVEDDIAKLHASILAAYQGQTFVGEIDKRFKDRTTAILQQLDGSLAATLDEAAKASDPGQQANLVGQARTILARYETVSTNPLLADLDANPFVPLSIQKTVAATLAALSKALH